ncbi:NHL repeat protein [Legionella steigerwaltii]|uniref:NHL repeat protein n=1 Tax=Legionella steigerwaltii TaxID=460 RepID=A0A378LB60_9GAMM|nr:YCF48-related protein [Legionella steigerwaltii]KTD70329.1 NHL repeat protein [Legionella steigerwaltii]STY24063.1 NHL repeat protein [Legionella steigerwaltii]
MQIFKASLPQLFIAVVAFLFLTISHASKPVWTFTPDPNYPPTVSVTSIGSATIKYTVTNKSRERAHTLSMKSITGVTQDTSAGNCPNPFTLRAHHSCTLNLIVNGSILTGNVKGGPVVCDQRNGLECYQPALADILNITIIPIARYVITPNARANGTINPNTPQTVLAGSSLTFTATPNANYQVDEWIVDGGTAQKGGTTYTFSNIDDNHTVEVTFTRRGTIYAGTASGSVYFSTDNGFTWTATSVPSAGNAVNSVFATQSTLYVGSADGKVYYSTNNGTSWTATTAPCDAINSVFVTATSTIYVGTQEGEVYYSSDNGMTWTATTTNPGMAPVNSIFLTPTSIYAGSDDGNVYFSTDNGDNWNQISGPESSVPVPIQNVFVVNDQLYVNTRQTSANGTLPPGTIGFEYAYFSNSSTAPNPLWTLLSQITYTLFVNSDASILHAGTQNGHVFSLTTGDDLGFITSSPITSLFFFG